MRAKKLFFFYIFIPSDLDLLTFRPRIFSSVTLV